MKLAEIDMVEMMDRMTMHVRILRLREARLRIWIATWLMILAAWIANMGIEFEDGE